MTDLHKAAQQALEALETYSGSLTHFNEVIDHAPAIAALRAALAQQAEPQDAELSAALGWPGGISEPVLDRKTLLQMVAALRTEREGYDIMGLAEEQRQKPGPFGGPGTPNAYVGA